MTTTPLVQERHDRFEQMLNAPSVPACEHILDGRPVLFCTMHGGGLMCERCMGEHLAVRHHDLTCDWCGERSVLAHWRSCLAIGVIRIRPPADDIALLDGPEIAVAWSSSCAIHEDETRAVVDAVNSPT